MLEKTLYTIGAIIVHSDKEMSKEIKKEKKEERKEEKEKEEELEEIVKNGGELLVVQLSIEEIKKDPKYLYVALASAKLVVIDDYGYHTAFRPEDVLYIQYTNREEPYIIIYFKNGQTEDVGYEPETREKMHDDE